MTNIVPIALNSDVAAIKAISRVAFNHLIVNNTLIAGLKVKNKIGGPVMLVQGFRESIPYGYYAEINKDAQVAEWCLNSFQKVQLNSEGLTPNEILKTDRYAKSVPVFIFFENSLTSNAKKVGDSLYVICKYRSDIDDRYLYQIENLHELEIIN